MTFWFFVLGLPLALFGAFALVRPAAASRFLVAFPRHAPSGVVLCALGWLGTAYEVDTIGIEVFDRIVRRFWFLQNDVPGAVWILAIILTVLTCLWMSNLLPIRGLAAIFMLFPAELFPAIRLCETPWRLTLVVFAYLCAMAGMFGMFYPWRIRQVWAWIADEDRRVRIYGAFHAVWGALFLVLGALAAAGSLK